MKTKLLAALAAVAALAGGAASVVQATTFSDVNASFCAFSGGQTTKPSGTELRLRIGVNSYNQGNLIAWRTAETTNVVMAERRST
jgi:poly(3-hydroxybutyrate) depolymerase